MVLDVVRLGVTPFTGEVPATHASAWLKVRMHGYAAVKTKVALEPGEVPWTVELRAMNR